MEQNAQSGNTLLETAVALAIVAALGGAIASSSTAAAHYAAGDAVRTVLQAAVEREMRIALDVLKYRDATIVPVSVATTLPMPAGSPLPVTLSLQTSARGYGAIDVTITAVADNANERATSSATIGARAPLPGSQEAAPGLVPAPTGAP